MTCTVTQNHLNMLADTIEGNSIPMAVVDYIGFNGEDWKGKKVCRMVDETAPADYRFGVRSISDCEGYGFKPLLLNKAARDRAAK